MNPVTGIQFRYKKEKDLQELSINWRLKRKFSVSTDNSKVIHKIRKEMYCRRYNNECNFLERKFELIKFLLEEI